MKHKKIATGLVLATIFGVVNAEYTVKFPLDPKAINIGNIAIDGSANVSPSQTDRGGDVTLS